MGISETRVLVTRASRGIGQHLARGFAAAGADVALVARSARPLAPEVEIGEVAETAMTEEGARTGVLGADGP